MYEIILKKKRGEALTDAEIKRVVEGYTLGSIPDYQMSALLMAICFQGMDEKETSALTHEMAHSGDTLDLSELGDLSADKHSTGGVGDKTTLIVAPLLACMGLKVAKMSGRGLGHTGGTVDKLESIKGYKSALDPASFIEQTKKVGVCVIGQSKNLAPADKKLYALRDVTATVDNIPLIASSIMSKKLAAGAKNIVLDVKYGSGAFMKTPEAALSLAECMVNIGKMAKRNTRALITNMNEPLGKNIGNSLEVIEAIEILNNKGDVSLRALCISLASNLSSMALNIPYEQAEKEIIAHLESKRAFYKFREWIVAQGGSGEWIDNPSLFPKAKYSEDILSDSAGYISELDTEKLGLSSLNLGAGRKVKDDSVDFTAGIILHKKAGDFVGRGEKIATLYTNNKSLLPISTEIFKDAVTLSNVKPTLLPLIYKAVK